MLTPLAVDPAHPFPYISGLSLNLAVTIRNPETGKEHFARVKVPPIFPRLVALGDQRFVPLEDVIAAHLDQLFPGMEVLQHHTFRVTRNEDLEVEEDDAENLLKAARARAATPPLRVAGPSRGRGVDRPARARPARLRARRRARPRSSTSRVRSTSPACTSSPTSTGPSSSTPPSCPRRTADLAEVESASPSTSSPPLSRRDVLLHHPYDSFATSVQRFIEQAAADPQVLAIKQTLYRTCGDSPIIDALIDAAEAGKQVLVLVEIKARFDEQANIRWARKLEQAGCHVVYGLVGLKTHCKLALVVRDEGGRHPPVRPHRHRQLQPQDGPHVRGPRAC